MLLLISNYLILCTQIIAGNITVLNEDTIIDCNVNQNKHYNYLFTILWSTLYYEPKYTIIDYHFMKTNVIIPTNLS